MVINCVQNGPQTLKKKSSNQTMYDYCTIIFNPGRWFQLPWKNEKIRSSLGIIIHFYGWKLFSTNKSVETTNQIRNIYQHLSWAPKMTKAAKIIFQPLLFRGQLRSLRRALRGWLWWLPWLVMSSSSKIESATVAGSWLHKFNGNFT